MLSLLWMFFTSLLPPPPLAAAMAAVVSLPLLVADEPCARSLTRQLGRGANGIQPSIPWSTGSTGAQASGG